MECTSCGHRNPEPGRFCSACGRALAPWRGAALEPRSYTPRHLAERILRSRSALEGERKQVTVLFADVKGSMELAQAMDPEEWHAILDRFFQLLTEGVHLFEGTINQYTGDGVMALFGAPIAHEDHAQRACHAALHLRDAFAHYADELRDSLGLDFSVRMGLNSGEVVVGKIGDDLRMDYTASGHTVGLAQRMEQLAESGHAYVTERTAALVEGFFELRERGVFPVKGSREPVRAYALETPGPLRSRFDLSRARGFSRFVGRSAELRVLESALQDALGGRGRIVCVTGEPGMGKSRLCYEFAELCRGRGVPVFEAHGAAHGRQLPLLPILELLRGFLGLDEGDAAWIAREKIGRRARRLGPQLGGQLPLVFDLLGVSDPATPLEPIDPEAHHRRMLQAIQATVFGDREPAVLLLEDLHWLDAVSDGILAQLLPLVRASPRLVLANFRPEYAAPWTDEPSCEHVSLRPLAREDVRQLLGELLGDDRSLRHLCARIESRTRGNPFFIEEVVRMLAEAGVLAGSRGARRLAREVETLDVPESVRTVLAARIDRLGEREKGVLQAAAVIGEEVPLQLLAAVVDLPERELADALSRLRDTAFLYEVRALPRSEYAFRHPLTEAVAYETQLRQKRARVHAAVARAVLKFDPDRLDEQAARLAHHFELADEACEAARWHRKAAEWIGSAQPAEALRHWRRVRQLARRPGSPVDAEDLAAACLQTLNLGWRLDVSDEELRSAVGQCRENAGSIAPAHIVRVICAYAVCQSSRGAIRDNVAPLSEALRVAKAERSPDMEIDVLMTLQHSMWWLGRLKEAERHCTRVLALTKDDCSHVNFGGTSSRIESLANRGAIRAELGRHRQGLEDLELALRLADEQSRGENLLIALRCAVLAAELSGETQRSLFRARRLAQLALKNGSPLWTLDASLCTGIAFACNERWHDAIGPLEQVIGRIDERGFAKQKLGRALTALARAYLGAGRPDDALRTAQRAVRTCRTGEAKSVECLARLALARVQLAKEGAAARRKVRAGLSRVEVLVDATGARGHQPFACLVRALLARAGGDAEAAELELARAERLFARMGAGSHSERAARERAGSRAR